MHSVSSPPQTRVFLDSSDRFRERFDRESFLFEHALSQDSRFEMGNLSELARRLPSRYYDAGHVETGTPWNQAPKQCSFEEAIARLSTSDSWIILKRVHDDPLYAPLFEDCMKEVAELSGRPLDREIQSKTMSVIMTSPNRVTPYHMDGDCNFLFQIRGEKTLYVFDGTDRSVLTDEEIERFWFGDLYAAQFRDEIQSRGTANLLKPGLGVHVPINFPHWAQNHDDVSISLSVNFQFADSLYDAWRGNCALRKLGFRPSPIESSREAPAIKAAVGAAARWTRQVVRKFRS